MVGESFHPRGCWGEDSNHIRLGATVQKLLRLFAFMLLLRVISLLKADRSASASSSHMLNKEPVPALYQITVTALGIAKRIYRSAFNCDRTHGWPNRDRYSVETMNALTISALTKLPLKAFSFASQTGDRCRYCRAGRWDFFVSIRSTASGRMPV